MKLFLYIFMFCLMLLAIENNQATLTDEKKAFLNALSSDDKNKHMEYFEKELKTAEHELELHLEKAIQSYSSSIPCKDFIIIVNLQNQVFFFRQMIAMIVQSAN